MKSSEEINECPKCGGFLLTHQPNKKKKEGAFKQCARNFFSGGSGLDNIGCGWNDKDTESEGEGEGK